MRQATVERKTKETQIKVSWELDGSGNSIIQTELPFLNHMLELFTKHGYFNLNINLKGDIEIDEHHSVEDLGIVMGQALKQALGDKKSIKRYGFFLLPMDESLVKIALDLSNRPHLEYDVTYTNSIHNFDAAVFKEFFQAFVLNAGLTLHIRKISGDNTHHIFEAIFKGLAKALYMAISKEPREKGVPSTKGTI